MGETGCMKKKEKEYDNIYSANLVSEVRTGLKLVKLLSSSKW